MTGPVRRFLRDRWEKNGPGLVCLATGGFNRFLLPARPRPLDPQRDGVPVFCYHDVDAAAFSADLDALAAGGYRTLTAEAFRLHARGETIAPAGSVLLTVDDGAASLHDVIWPALRERGMHAIAFVCPRLHRDTDADPAGFCTWSELRRMQASGEIDCQPHTPDHRDLVRWPEPVPLTGVDREAAARRQAAGDGRDPDRTASLRAARDELADGLGIAVERLTHLALPRHHGSAAVRRDAAAAGFDVIYGGFEPGRVLQRPSDDPLRVPRLLPGALHRLPGPSRRTLADAARRWLRPRTP